MGIHNVVHIPNFITTRRTTSPLAQLVERATVNREASSSILLWRAFFLFCLFYVHRHWCVVLCVFSSFAYLFAIRSYLCMVCRCIALALFFSWLADFISPCFHVTPSYFLSKNVGIQNSTDELLRLSETLLQQLLSARGQHFFFQTQHLSKKRAQNQP